MSQWCMAINSIFGHGSVMSQWCMGINSIFGHGSMMSQWSTYIPICAGWQTDRQTHTRTFQTLLHSKWLTAFAIIWALAASHRDCTWWLTSLKTERVQPRVQGLREAIGIGTLADFRCQHTALTASKCRNMKINHAHSDVTVCWCHSDVCIPFVQDDRQPLQAASHRDRTWWLTSLKLERAQPRVQGLREAIGIGTLADFRCQHTALTASKWRSFQLLFSIQWWSNSVYDCIRFAALLCGELPHLSVLL